MQTALVLLMISPVFAQENAWKISGDKIAAPWAAEVDPASPLPEYPRPQMVRKDWENLNGWWEYGIRDRKRAVEGKIVSVRVDLGGGVIVKQDKKKKESV